MQGSNTVSIELTETELTVVRNALQSFRADFGHDEADVLHAVQAVLAKLSAIDAATGHQSGSTT